MQYVMVCNLLLLKRAEEKGMKALLAIINTGGFEE